MPPGRRPRFSYDTGPTILDMQYPCRVWTHSERPLGGFEESASGIGVAYEIRRDYRRHLELVFHEQEELGVLAFLRWAQRNPATPFDYFPDRDDLGVSFSCYLEAPRMPEDVHPRPHETHGWLTLELTIRRTVESPFTGNYFST